MAKHPLNNVGPRRSVINAGQPTVGISDFKGEVATSSGLRWYPSDVSKVDQITKATQNHYNSRRLTRSDILRGIIHNIHQRIMADPAYAEELAKTIGDLRR